MLFYKQFFAKELISINKFKNHLSNFVDWLKLELKKTTSWKQKLKNPDSVSVY